MWWQCHLVCHWPDSLQDLIWADESGGELLRLDGSPDYHTGCHANKHVISLGELEVSPPLIRVTSLPTLRSPHLILNCPNLLCCLLHQLRPQRQAFPILMPT